MSDALENVLGRFPSARKNGSGFIALCPAHADKTPSLSINMKDGKVLLHCHAGCTTEAVCAAAGMETRDLFADEAPPERKVVATYDYTDENGALLFQTVRYEPKGFAQRRPDGKGGWVWKLGDVHRVLYNLPEVLKSDHALVVEGEKDVETAKKLGLVATCNPMGAGKWRDEYSESLRGKHVTVNPDTDAAGRKHGEDVARSLHLRAASVKMVKMPSGIKDLTELFERGFSREAIVQLVEQAASWSPDKQPPAEVGGSSVAEILAATEVEVPWFAWPLAAPGFATIVDGLPKLAGKTVLLLAAVLAISLEKYFLGRPTRKTPIVFVSEQSRPSLADQLRKLNFPDIPGDQLVFVTREDWAHLPFPDLVAAIEKKWLAPLGAGLLAVDTFYAIARLENENDSSEINAAAKLVLDLTARLGIALALSRHDRKAGGEIGVSGRGGIQLTGLMDIIAHLGRPGGKADPALRVLRLLGRVDLPEQELIELTPQGYESRGDRKDVKTANVERQILERAPTSRDAALPIMEIMEGTGVKHEQPLKSAVARLLKLGALSERMVGKQKRYWTDAPTLDLGSE